MNRNQVVETLKRALGPEDPMFQINMELFMKFLKAEVLPLLEAKPALVPKTAEEFEDKILPNGKVKPPKGALGVAGEGSLPPPVITVGLK